MKKLILIASLCCIALCGCKMGNKPKQNQQKTDAERVTDNDITYDLNTLGDAQFLAKYRGPFIISAKYLSTEGHGNTIELYTEYDDKRLRWFKAEYRPRYVFGMGDARYLAQFKGGDWMTFRCEKIYMSGKDYVRFQDCVGMQTEEPPAEQQEKKEATNSASAVNADNQSNGSASSLSGEYTTEKHNIRITQNSDGTYRYTAWKKPKQFNQGKPDLEIDYGEVYQTNQKCYPERIDFYKGNLDLAVVGNSPCSSGTPGESAGQIFIFINGVRKDHYYLYR